MKKITLIEPVLDGKQVGPVVVQVDGASTTASIVDSILNGQGSEIHISVDEGLQILGLEELAELQAQLADIEARVAQVLVALDVAVERANEVLAELNAAMTDLAALVLRAEEAARNASASEVAAKASEVAAKASELASKTSELAAALSATAASDSEVAAKTSEVAAAASQVAAALSEINSLASENAAQASKVASESAKVLAQKYANAPEGVVVEADQYSSFHWAEQAKKYAQQVFVSAGTFAPTLLQPYPDLTEVTRDTIWIVKLTGKPPTFTYTTGPLAGITVTSGDFLFYDTPANQWEHIPVGLVGILEVNGKGGTMVTLTAQDVEALPLSGGTLTGSLRTPSLTAHIPGNIGVSIGSNASFCWVAPTNAAGSSDFPNQLAYNPTAGYWTAQGGKIYTTNQKPTASEVGALPTTGGDLTGVLRTNSHIRSTVDAPIAFTHTRGDNTAMFGVSSTPREFVFGGGVRNNTEYDCYVRVGQTLLQYNPTSTTTYDIYHSGNKPTTQDVGAIASSVAGVTSQDWDTLTIAGSYSVNHFSGPNAPSVDGHPAVYTYGTLFVQNSGLSIAQLYITDSNRLYIRNKYSTNPWDNWTSVSKDESMHIRTSTDLNTLTMGGTYNLYKAPGSVFDNAPSGFEFGTMQVIGLGQVTHSFVTQILTDKNNGGQWVRTRNDGSFGWGSWKKIYSEAFKPTAADVGANPTFGIKFRPNGHRFMCLGRIGRTDNSATMIISGVGDLGGKSRDTIILSIASRGDVVTVDANRAARSQNYAYPTKLFTKDTGSAFELWIEGPTYQQDFGYTLLSSTGWVDMRSDLTNTNPEDLTEQPIGVYYTTTNKPTASDVDAVDLTSSQAKNGSLQTNSIDYHGGTAPSVKNLGYSGFYRLNGPTVDGHKMPDLSIHCAHSNGKAHSRGIGFAYGPSWGLTTTAWGSSGEYLGQKKVYTEMDRPTASEVGALPISGGTMVGPLRLLKESPDQLQGMTHTEVNVDSYASETDAVFSYARFASPAPNLFPTVSNANGVLSLNTHAGRHNHQLGFSSNGKLYHRTRAGGGFGAWGALFSEGNKPNAIDTGIVLNGSPLGSTAGWYKIGVATMPQSASTVVIEVSGGSGFNTGNFPQATETSIVLRAGNGNPKGITAVVYQEGGAAQLIKEVSWKAVPESNDYEIYVDAGAWGSGVAGIIFKTYTSVNAAISLVTTPVSLGTTKPSGLTDGLSIVSYNSRHKPTAADVGAAPSLDSKATFVPSGTTAQRPVAQDFPANTMAMRYNTETLQWEGVDSTGNATPIGGGGGGMPPFIEKTESFTVVKNQAYALRMSDGVNKTVTVPSGFSNTDWFVLDMTRWDRGLAGVTASIVFQGDVLTNGTADFTSLRIDRPCVATFQKIGGKWQWVDGIGVEGSYNALESRIDELETWPQTGQNGNGYWEKHKDGRMECWFSGGLSYPAGVPYGSLYQSLGSWGFPQAFIAPPTMLAGGIVVGSAAAWCTAGNAPSNTAGSVRLLDVGPNAAGTYFTQVRAIGRWK